MLLYRSTADNAFLLIVSSKDNPGWITDNLSRKDKNQLTFMEAAPFQQRLAGGELKLYFPHPSEDKKKKS